MACRRNDRARFVGCHVGSIRVSGCERGCCPYGYEPADIEENERLDYSRLADDWVKGTYTSNPYPNVYRPQNAAPASLNCCLSHYRPKYVCTPCRRVFKPAVLDMKEYEIELWSGWWVFPKRSEIPEIWERWLILDKARWKDPSRNAEVQRLRGIENDMMARYRRGEVISKEELAAIRTLDNPNPNLWREPLRTSCPGCSKEGTPVGETFRAPKRDDIKGWKQVESLLQCGERFTYCLNEEKEVEVLQEAARVNARREGAEAWAEEKRRRIQDLTGKIAT